MAKNNDPYAMASQVSQQESRYTMTAPSNSRQSQSQNNQPHSSMPPPPHPDYQASSYTIPTSLFVPSSSPAAIPTETPTDPLEQRILDLLYPYRDECFEDFAALTETKERNALILCGTVAALVRLHQRANSLAANIAFLVRHNQSSYGKTIEPNDVSIASRAWQSMKKGHGVAGIGFFVNGNGFSHTVVRTTIGPGDSAVEKLTTQVDKLTQTFFPEAGA
jgi:hypothetical protein